jgi:hypothetical protein
VLGDERLHLADERAMPAELELGVDPVLERGQPQLLQAADLVLRKRLVRELGQRAAVPEL